MIDSTSCKLNELSNFNRDLHIWKHQIYQKQDQFGEMVECLFMI